MSSRKHEQLSQDTKNRRARIADVTALIHFALFVVSIFAIEIIGCVYGSSYSRVSTILGPILWDVCVVTLLILFLIRYKWDHTANREAVLTRVLCFVEVAVIYVTLGLLITFVTPPPDYASFQDAPFKDIAAILCYTKAGYLTAVAVLNTTYTLQQGLSMRQMFGGEAISRGVSKAAARDHRARLAGILLHIYLACYMIACIGLNAPSSSEGEDNRGLLAVFIVQLLWIVTYLVVRAFSPNSPVACVAWTSTVYAPLVVVTAAGTVAVMVTAEYMPSAAFFAFVGIGITSVIVIFETLYTFIHHRNDGGWKSNFAAGGSVSHGDIEMVAERAAANYLEGEARQSAVCTGCVGRPFVAKKHRRGSEASGPSIQKVGSAENISDLPCKSAVPCKLYS